MRTVAEAMLVPPALVAPATTIQEASQAMLDAETHAAIVVDDGRVCGIATADDVARALTEGYDASETPIGVIAQRDAVVLRADDRLLEAHERMRAAAHPAAPVVDDHGAPVGLLVDPEA